jgi:hypothetical protein
LLLASIVALLAQALECSGKKCHFVSAVRSYMICHGRWLNITLFKTPRANGKLLELKRSAI